MPPLAIAPLPSDACERDALIWHERLIGATATHVRRGPPDNRRILRSLTGERAIAGFPDAGLWAALLRDGWRLELGPHMTGNGLFPGAHIDVAAEPALAEAWDSAARWWRESGLNIPEEAVTVLASGLPDGPRKAGEVLGQERQVGQMAVDNGGDGLGLSDVALTLAGVALGIAGAHPQLVEGEGPRVGANERHRETIVADGDGRELGRRLDPPHIGDRRRHQVVRPE